MVRRPYDFDEHIIKERQQHALRLERRALRQPKRKFRYFAEEAPSRNICPRHAADERLLAEAVTERLSSEVEAGRLVGYFVTLVLPDWQYEGGTIPPESVSQIAAWVSRRARNLAPLGQWRLIGFVDITWNDRSDRGELSFWQLHAHFSVFVPVGADRRIRAAIRAAFKPPPADATTFGVPRVQCQIKPLRTPDDVRRVGYYASRALQLELNRRRFSPRQGAPKNVDLTRHQQDEMTHLFLRLGPRRFRILSGLRQRGGRIVRHNSTSAALARN